VWIVAEHAIALAPGTPLAHGHIVIAPRRHVPLFYDLDVQEQRAVWDLVGPAQKLIADSLQVERVHIGFADADPNSGGHACVHVVPNRPGEHLDLPAEVDWIADGSTSG
jgi:diadenosine tetraphosphate (Ap4A) HIT family hydrolase